MNFYLHNKNVNEIVNKKMKNYNICRRNQWRILQEKLFVYRSQPYHIRLSYDHCLWEMMNQPKMYIVKKKIQEKICKRYAIWFSVIQKIPIMKHAPEEIIVSISEFFI